MNIFKSILLTGVLISPAFAYIDPGTGSAIISAIIGFLVASGMAIKAYWYKIKDFFQKRK